MQSWLEGPPHSARGVRRSSCGRASSSTRVRSTLGVDGTLDQDNGVALRLSDTQGYATLRLAVVPLLRLPLWSLGAQAEPERSLPWAPSIRKKKGLRAPMQTQSPWTPGTRDAHAVGFEPSEQHLGVRKRVDVAPLHPIQPRVGDGNQARLHRAPSGDQQGQLRRRRPVQDRVTRSIRRLEMCARDGLAPDGLRGQTRSLVRCCGERSSGGEVTPRAWCPFGMTNPVAAPEMFLRRILQRSSVWSRTPACARSFSALATTAEAPI